ncbi:TPA: ead/Ea22-like family protein [Klebsiella michiganensis]|nr:ead/Ea22-like family protein [Klebsiella michiganensis]
MTEAELALERAKKLAFLMTERFSMNPISAKLLNEAWRLAFPDEVAVARRMRALVEALEKAQAGEKQWREVVDAFCTDDADWHNLTNSNNELIALLSQALCEQADRIAELESCTVKLPRPGFITISGERMAVYLKSDVDAAMLAAGIEEAE